MQVRIKETGEIAELTIIDPKTGLDWAADITGNDDNFGYDEDYDVRVCDQETFDWWANLIRRYQKVDDRYYEIRKGLDDDTALLEHVSGYIDVDLENYPEALSQALDAWNKKNGTIDLTTAQAAEKLGISQRRVQALITAGKIKATMAGKTWLIDPTELKKIKNRNPGRPPKRKKK